MYRILSYLSLLSLTLIQAHPLHNITADTEIHGKRQTNGHLQLNALHVPYPVPGKPFTIHFRVQDKILPRDTRNCVLRAYTALKDHIQQHGDDPIPQHPAALHFRYNSVAFGIWPTTVVPPQPVLSDSDAIEILRALAMESTREGYRQTFGRIFHTPTGLHLGDASLYPI
ncbi:MAG: hypothetical protein Q9226_006873 [Calogaya cf. arnoldii]